jgi:IclR family acetate operon transcriptional repressor
MYVCCWRNAFFLFSVDRRGMDKLNRNHNMERCSKLWNNCLAPATKWARTYISRPKIASRIRFERVILHMKSIFKALDIIESISEAGATGIRELAAATGFPPPTTHRIVSALVQRGYLRKTGRPPRYALASKFLMLADGIHPRNEVALTARPYLEQLVRLTGENANLCIRDGRYATYIDHIRSRKHNLRIFTRIGAKAPLYASGVGKIFLSSMDAHRLKAYLQSVDLKPLTPHTITERDHLRAEIQKIRKSGYSVDNQEKEIGVCCIAAPLFNHRGIIDSAISISGAAQRITAGRLRELAGIVKKAAGDISNERGFPPRKTIS